MRPIDANALIVEQCGQCDGACEMFDGEKCLVCKADCHCDLREAIDNAPTIDYEPVRHSQWILHNMNPHRVTVDGYVVCPECEHTFDRIKGTWFKRCPNCGARMNAKEDGK